MGPATDKKAIELQEGWSFMEVGRSEKLKNPLG
jgi:hypothetical protein